MKTGIKVILLFLVIFTNSIFGNYFSTGRKVDIHANIETLQFIHAVNIYFFLYLIFFL